MTFYYCWLFAKNLQTGRGQPAPRYIEVTCIQHASIATVVAKRTRGNVTIYHSVRNRDIERFSDADWTALTLYVYEREGLAQYND